MRVFDADMFLAQCRELKDSWREDRVSSFTLAASSFLSDGPSLSYFIGRHCSTRGKKILNDLELCEGKLTDNKNIM